MEAEINTGDTVTTRSTGIRFGFIGALVSITYFLILNLAGLEVTRALWTWVGYLITLVIIVFAHKYYKDRREGFMSYGQGIGIALWFGLVSGLISGLFTYLYIKFIDTGFLELVKERQIEQLQQQGFSDEQIDRVVEASSVFMSPETMFLFMVIGSIIASIIIALIVTIFTQKNNPEPAF